MIIKRKKTQLGAWNALWDFEQRPLIMVLAGVVDNPVADDSISFLTDAKVYTALLILSTMCQISCYVGLWRMYCYALGWW